ncbi:FAD-binding oxidoreductase [Brevundimonas sp.]|uniref:FAD-binding oxidoreductase n=1 Tax=Brevundimonas sp. TaxID=1871086 RepID=UPI003918A1F4
MLQFGRRGFLTGIGAAGFAGLASGWSRPASAWTPDAYPGFDAAFGEGVIRPGAADYDRLTHVYQARAQVRPALFAHCRSTDDVARGVRAARDSGASLAVRCGGHSYAGHSLGDGGAVLDLSGLRGVAVSPDGSSVTVGGGALAGMIDAVTTPLGRATTLGQCPTVGIGGFTLGGGVGALMGRHGLGCDNLISADVVLADGRVVTAGADGDSDLYWAIRGGGGNFGVAASMTFRLHEVRDVLGGFVTLRSQDPADMLRLYGAFCADLPDDLVPLAMAVPDREGRPILSVQLCHRGEPDQGERDVADFLSSPFVVSNEVRRMPYVELQNQGPPEIPVLASVNRGGFTSALDEAAAGRLAAALSSAPGPYMLGLVPVQGAVTRVDMAATAFPLRRPGMAFDLTAILTGPEALAPTTAWVTGLQAALSDPGAGAYVNVMGDEGPAAVRQAYGANYDRLAMLKARYDPDNLFRFNQNVPPAA